MDEVVFAEPGDMSLVGVRTLDGFGVMVDNIAHRFVGTTTIVALGCAAPMERKHQGEGIVSINIGLLRSRSHMMRPPSPG